MNYNNMLCNYCISSTGNSNFNIRIVKPSQQKNANIMKVCSIKIDNKIIKLNKKK